MCVCAHTHILSERLQRLPSADPLTSGAMSQRSADTMIRQKSHSTVHVCRILHDICMCTCVCFQTCVLAVCDAGH